MNNIKKRVLINIYEDGEVETNQYTNEEWDALLNGTTLSEIKQEVMGNGTDVPIRVGAYYQFIADGSFNITGGVLRVTHVDDDMVAYTPVAGMKGDDESGHGFGIGTIFHHKLRKIKFAAPVGARVYVKAYGKNRIGTIISVAYDDHSKEHSIVYGVRYDERDQYDYRCAALDIIIGKEGDSNDCGWVSEDDFEVID